MPPNHFQGWLFAFLPPTKPDTETCDIQITSTIAVKRVAPGGYKTFPSRYGRGRQMCISLHPPFTNRHFSLDKVALLIKQPHREGETQQRWRPAIVLHHHEHKADIQWAAKEENNPALSAWPLCSTVQMFACLRNAPSLLNQGQSYII